MLNLERKCWLILALVVSSPIYLYVPSVAQPCTVIVDPGESIQSAIDAAAEGDVICLTAGTWYEHLQIQKSLTLQGSEVERTIIQAPKTDRPVLRIESDSEIKVSLRGFTATGARGTCVVGYPQWICAYGIQVRGRAKADLEDIKIFDNQGSSGHGAGLKIEQEAIVTLQNSISSSNQYGIEIWNSATAIVSNTQIFGNNGAGLSIFGLVASSTVTLINVQISGNGACGLAAQGSATITLQDSQIFDNEVCGIAIWGSVMAILSNLRVSGNGRNGFQVEESATAEVYNSVIESNGTNSLCQEKDTICNGIYLNLEAQITITDSVIRHNTDWGIAALLKKCGYDVDNFTGQVIFRGNNQIYGNNTAANHQGEICLLEVLPGFPALDLANLDPKKRVQLYRVIKEVLNVEQAKLEREGKYEYILLFERINLLLKQLDPNQQEKNLKITDIVKEHALSEAQELFVNFAGAIVGAGITFLSRIPGPFLGITEPFKLLGFYVGEKLVLGEIGSAIVKYPQIGRMEVVYRPSKKKILVNISLEEPVKRALFLIIPVKFKPLRTSWGTYICSPMWCGLTCPPEAAVKEPVPKLEDIQIKIVNLRSPGRLRVYDSQGRVTGLVNKEVKEEIPDSEYVDGTVVIFSPSNSYYYEVLGIAKGEYGLEVTSIENGEVNTFTATDIPISPGAIHQYTIDWEALSRGEKGVTLRIDSDGNGIFERTIRAGSTLTGEEIVIIPPTVPPTTADIEAIRDLAKSTRSDADLLSTSISITFSQLLMIWEDIDRALELLGSKASPDLETILHGLTLWPRVISGDIEGFEDALDDLEERAKDLKDEIDRFKAALEPEESGEIVAAVSRLFPQLNLLYRQINRLEDDLDDLKDLFEESYEAFKEEDLRRTRTLLELAKGKLIVAGARIFKMLDLLSLSEKLLRKLDRDLEDIQERIESKGLSSIPSQISNLILKGIKLSPNPAKTLATFEAQGQGIEEIKLQIFDLGGKLIYESGFRAGKELRWDFSTNQERPLANGVYLYIVTVRGYDGQELRREVKKLVVLR